LKNKNSKSPALDFIKPEIQQKLLKFPWSFDVITKDSQYVDLTQDKEEFTGYKGKSIWDYLYDNNCKKSF